MMGHIGRGWDRGGGGAVGTNGGGELDARKGPYIYDSRTIFRYVDPLPQLFKRNSLVAFLLSAF